MRRSETIERLRQDLDDLSARLAEARAGAAIAERERQVAQVEMEDARRVLARQQHVLARARRLLTVVQDSKFWQIRNSWFALKQRIGIPATGPIPRWIPEPDENVVAREPYQVWVAENRIRLSDVARMRAMLPNLAIRPKISVVMPVYNTPERLLREAIESVLGQAYPDWELCAADDASRAPHVRAVLEEYAQADRRIRLVFRETNGHIAAASNSALAATTGEFVALLDHDDRLAADALFEVALAINARPDADVLYSDEDKIDIDGRRYEPYFKPDWSPESLLGRNYVSHLGVYRRSIVERAGGFRVGFEGSQDYDLLLRVTEISDRVVHIPRVLYHWRSHTASTAEAREHKGYAQTSAIRALEEALARRGEAGRVDAADAPGVYTVRYRLRQDGLVSIIVPTRDHGEDVDRCLGAIFERSSYRDVQVILIDNGSTDPASIRTFERWREREASRLAIVRLPIPFNFSRLNNEAVRHAAGRYLLFLNNDTEAIAPDWIEALLEQAQRPPIGAAGAKLLYPDGSVQHGGVIIGLGGVAGHSHKHFAGDAPGYFYGLQAVTNYSAVTAACMMVRREVFDAVGGFDEELAIAFNDVDFCLRLLAAGYRNVYVPHAVLYHHESKSRGYEDTPEKQARFEGEIAIMHRRWRTAEVDDPYYNPNLTLMTEDYAIRR